MALSVEQVEGGRRNGKSAAAFRTISEVADDLEVPPHVLRFWETKFAQVRPLKRGGGRRYYRPEDILLLKQIRGLLYRDGYTIKGVQKLLRDGQVKLPAEADGRAAEPDPVEDEVEATAEVAEAASTSAPTSVEEPAAIAEETRDELHALLDELTGLKEKLDRLRARAS
jgi:DNA-binding transcriptional MerR regulator